MEVITLLLVFLYFSKLDQRLEKGSVLTFSNLSPMTYWWRWEKTSGSCSQQPIQVLNSVPEETVQPSTSWTTIVSVTAMNFAIIRYIIETSTYNCSGMVYWLVTLVHLRNTTLRSGNSGYFHLILHCHHRVVPSTWLHIASLWVWISAELFSTFSVMLSYTNHIPYSKLYILDASYSIH